jgi:hypothetical protein
VIGVVTALTNAWSLMANALSPVAITSNSHALRKNPVIPAALHTLLARATSAGGNDRSFFTSAGKSRIVYDAVLFPGG